MEECEVLIFLTGGTLKRSWFAREKLKLWLASLEKIDAALRNKAFADFEGHVSKLGFWVSRDELHALIADACAKVKATMQMMPSSNMEPDLEWDNQSELARSQAINSIKRLNSDAGFYFGDAKVLADEFLGIWSIDAAS